MCKDKDGEGAGVIGRDESQGQHALPPCGANHYQSELRSPGFPRTKRPEKAHRSLPRFFASQKGGEANLPQDRDTMELLSVSNAWKGHRMIIQL